MSTHLPSLLLQHVSVAMSSCSDHLSSLRTRVSALQSSPLVRAVSQAVCIASTANIAAQLLHQYRQGEPLGIDFGLFIRFFLIAVIMAPLNYCWQALLERTFPGERSAGKKPTHHHDNISNDISQQRDLHESEVRLLPDTTPGGENGDGRYDPEYSSIEESKSKKTQSTKLYIRNTLLKLVVDCFLFGTWWNVIVFLILNGMLKLDPASQVLRSVKVETVPIVLNAFKVWPFALTIGLTLFPMEKRIVFYSTVNFFWSIYMSWVAGRETVP